jgi:hypothetical protein
MAQLLDAPQAKRAKTTAERQRAFRQRQADRIATLEAALADVRGQLADALAKTSRLTAQQCKHPAAAVDGGYCQACGTDVW